MSLRFSLRQTSDMEDYDEEKQFSETVGSHLRTTQAVEAVLPQVEGGNLHEKMMIVMSTVFGGLV